MAEFYANKQKINNNKYNCNKYKQQFIKPFIYNESGSDDDFVRKQN